MRALVALLVCTAALTLPTRAGATAPAPSCFTMPTEAARLDCVVWVHPALSPVWLAWHMPAQVPPWPWPCLYSHESSDTYSEDTGNGYFGAAQWLPSTWVAAVTLVGWDVFALGGRADLAPPIVQDVAAQGWAHHEGNYRQWGTAGVCGVYDTAA